MPTTYKILGQVEPPATTFTAVYTVPAATSTVVSSIIVCNKSTTQTTFSITVTQGGNAISNKDYIYSEVLIAGSDTFIATVGITLAATDIVRVYSGNNRISFSLYGTELT